ncbi:MAG: hypothetical protein U5N55_06870, partial [Cypionkella sp.]|nr:hypothetical protein [Cypionkella sp.]
CITRPAADNVNTPIALHIGLRRGNAGYLLALADTMMAGAVVALRAIWAKGLRRTCESDRVDSDLPASRSTADRSLRRDPHARRRKDIVATSDNEIQVAFATNILPNRWISVFGHRLILLSERRLLNLNAIAPVMSTVYLGELRNSSEDHARQASAGFGLKNWRETDRRCDQADYGVAPETLRPLRKKLSSGALFEHHARTRITGRARSTVNVK